MSVYLQVFWRYKLAPPSQELNESCHRDAVTAPAQPKPVGCGDAFKAGDDRSRDKQPAAAEETSRQSAELCTGLYHDSATHSNTAGAAKRVRLSDKEGTVFRDARPGEY